MEILLITVPISLLIALGFLGAFFWAVSDDQFDDLSSPAHRILVDDGNDEEARNG